MHCKLIAFPFLRFSVHEVVNVEIRFYGTETPNSPLLFTLFKNIIKPSLVNPWAGALFSQPLCDLVRCQERYHPAGGLLPEDSSNC